jgi:hypothetical protein
VLSYPEYAAMLLADGRLPVGGHTQSAGLEPALLGGLAILWGANSDSGLEFYAAVPRRAPSM